MISLDCFLRTVLDKIGLSDQEVRKLISVVSIVIRLFRKERFGSLEEVLRENIEVVERIMLS